MSDPPPNHAYSRMNMLLAAGTALIVIGWLLAVFTIESVRFVIFNPHGKTGFEVFLALGQLFGALVLMLSASGAERGRMRWLASALMVLGIGALGFGYALPLFNANPNPNVSMYGSLAVRTTATTLAAIGFLPPRTPAFTGRLLATILVGGFLVTVAIARIGDELPRLVRASDMDALLTTTALQSFPGLTTWHLGLGLLPFITATAAAWGVLVHVRDRAFGWWLVIAIFLLAGAQLHSLFWPSMYSSILTTTSALRFGLTIVVITGGIVELRQLSLERAALLAEEQERVRQLQQLGQMKRDFTSMVAHELASPLAAIGNLAQMISLGVLSQDDQQKVANRIEGEARILQLLVRDIQASADVERDDFAVSPRPVSLAEVFTDADAYGRTIRKDLPVAVVPPPDLHVMADPERLGQVIRNLLNNAVRHTPEGTPIMLRAAAEEDGIRVDVVDHGPGIDPADQALILEKFGRGRGAGDHGRGLGLYLSRRILQAHGTDLTVESKPGHGACFSFRLQEAP